MLCLPVAAQEPLTLEVLGTYTHGAFNEGAAEIAAYDPAMRTLFVVNGDTIDLLSLSDPTIPELSAAIETEPSPGDGATSPLVWLHPDDLSQSLIIGTDDNTGIGVYDLDGRLLQFETNYGAVGGADIRYGFGSLSTLIVGAAKDEARLLFFTVEPDSRTLIRLGELATGIRLQGVCLYHSPLTSTFYAIAFSEFGELEQYALTEDDGAIEARLARAIDVGGELEHCAGCMCRRAKTSSGAMARSLRTVSGAPLWIFLAAILTTRSKG